MGAPRDSEARRFYYVAWHRLEDAETLLDGHRWQGAVYLAGYAVECGLKASLIVRTAQARRREMLSDFVGRRGHDLSWLRQMLAVQGEHLTATIHEELALLSMWSTDLRYEASTGDPEDAQEFLDAARRVLRWIDERT